MRTHGNTILGLSLVLLFGACESPDSPTNNDEVGDGDGDPSTGTDSNSTGAPPPEGAPCETSSDCISPANPQCLEGECVPCDAGVGYCPTGYSCDPETGWCALACPMDGLDPGDDPAEDNDTPGTAASLNDGDDLSLWLCPGDEDYFEFGVDRGTVAYVSIIANAKPFDGNMDLELTGPSMLSIKSEGGSYGYPRAVEAIHTKVTEPGEYKLRAHLANGVGGLPYRLQVRLLRSN